MWVRQIINSAAYYDMVKCVIDTLGPMLLYVIIWYCSRKHSHLNSELFCLLAVQLIATLWLFWHLNNDSHVNVAECALSSLFNLSCMSCYKAAMLSLHFYFSICNRCRSWQRQTVKMLCWKSYWCHISNITLLPFQLYKFNNMSQTWKCF